MRRFPSMLRLQLSRIFNWRWVVCFIILLIYTLAASAYNLLHGMSYSLESLLTFFQTYLTADVMPTMHEMFNMAIFANPVFLMGLMFLSAIPFSVTVVQEQRSGAAPYYILRSSTASYTVSEMTASYLSGFTLAYCVSAGAALILYLVCPITVKPSQHPPLVFSFIEMMRSGHVGLSITLQCLIASLYAGVFSVCSAAFSCWMPNILYMVCVPYLWASIVGETLPWLSMVFTGSYTRLPAFLDPYQWLYSWPVQDFIIAEKVSGPFWREQAVWLELLYAVVVCLGYFLLFTGLAVYRMKRKYNHA